MLRSPGICARISKRPEPSSLMGSQPPPAAARHMWCAAGAPPPALGPAPPPPPALWHGGRPQRRGGPRRPLHQGPAAPAACRAAAAPASTHQRPASRGARTAQRVLWAVPSHADVPSCSPDASPHACFGAHLERERHICIGTAPPQRRAVQRERKAARHPAWLLAEMRQTAEAFLCCSMAEVVEQAIIRQQGYGML